VCWLGRDLKNILLLLLLYKNGCSRAKTSEELQNFMKFSDFQQNKGSVNP
jgi:hypothetical protein